MNVLEALYHLGAYLPVLLSLQWKNLLLVLFDLLDWGHLLRSLIRARFFTLFCTNFTKTFNFIFLLPFKKYIYYFTLQFCLLCYLTNKCLQCLIQVKVSSVCVSILKTLYLMCCVFQKASPLAYTMIYI